METKTLVELTEVSETVRRMGPVGFNLGGMMCAEDAVISNQEFIARADLVDDVPAASRNAYDRLRQLHTYGAFCYELFTVTTDQAPLVLELALRERFTAFYDGDLPLVNKSGDREAVPFAGFDQVFRLTRQGPYRRWKLRLRSGCDPIPVPVGLTGLLRWARAEGLLHGQRNRWGDRFTIQHRHHVAHPSGVHVLMPNESERMIWELAETINRLWGHPTQGGRLYPAPIDREIVVLARNNAGTMELLRPAQLRTSTYPDGWEFTILLAVWGDTFWSYHPEFESTAYPAECLYQAESQAQVISWLDVNGSAADSVDYLDRVFLIREGATGPDRPRRPSMAATLGNDLREGRWHAVRADYPSDAHAHVRRHVPSQSASSTTTASDDQCSDIGPCEQCPTDTIATGDLDSLLRLVGTVS